AQSNGKKRGDDRLIRDLLRVVLGWQASRGVMSYPSNRTNERSSRIPCALRTRIALRLHLRRRARSAGSERTAPRRSWSARSVRATGSAIDGRTGHRGGSNGQFDLVRAWAPEGNPGAPATLPYFARAGFLRAPDGERLSEAWGALATHSEVCARLEHGGTPFGGRLPDAATPVHPLRRARGGIVGGCLRCSRLFLQRRTGLGRLRRFAVLEATAGLCGRNGDALDRLEIRSTAAVRPAVAHRPHHPRRAER